MGSGWKRWTRERLAADELQGYIQDQVVSVWPSSSARNAALAGTDLKDGMVSYLTDTGRVEIRHGGAWRLLKYVGTRATDLAGTGAAADPTVRVSSAARAVANNAADLVPWTVDKAHPSVTVSGTTITVNERCYLHAHFVLFSDAGINGVWATYLNVNQGHRLVEDTRGRSAGFGGAGILRVPYSWDGYVDPGFTMQLGTSPINASGTTTTTTSGYGELTLS